MGRFRIHALEPQDSGFCSFFSCRVILASFVLLALVELVKKVVVNWVAGLQDTSTKVISRTNTDRFKPRCHHDSASYAHKFQPRQETPSYRPSRCEFCTCCMSYDCTQSSSGYQRRTMGKPSPRSQPSSVDTRVRQDYSLLDAQHMSSRDERQHGMRGKHWLDIPCTVATTPRVQGDTRVGSREWGRI